MEFDEEQLREFLINGNYIKCGKTYSDQLKALNIASYVTGFEIGFEYEVDPGSRLAWDHVFVDPEIAQVHMTTWPDEGYEVLSLRDISLIFGRDCHTEAPDFEAIFADLGIN